MKKAISLLLSVLLVGSLAGFTSAKDPVHVFSSAVEKTAAAPALDVVQRSDVTLVMSDGSRYTSRLDAKMQLRRTPQGSEMILLRTFATGDGVQPMHCYYKNGYYYDENAQEITRIEMDEETFRNSIIPVIGSAIDPEWMSGLSVERSGTATRVDYRIARGHQPAYYTERVQTDPTLALTDVITKAMSGNSEIGADGRMLREELRLQNGFLVEGEMVNSDLVLRSWYSYPKGHEPLIFPDDLETGWDE